MNDSAPQFTPIKLPEPQFATRGPLIIAGLTVPMRDDAATAVPQLWQQFLPYFGKISQQINNEGYGICLRKDVNRWDFDYMAGCAVWDITELPDSLTALTIPEQKYAIFAHDGHVSQIKLTIDAIFAQWLPNSQYQHLADIKDVPYFIEFYGETFDGATGLGGMEIWLPIKLKQ